MRIEDLTSLVEKAHFIRAFENALGKAYDAGHVPGLVHLSNGAELIELAVASHLHLPKDQVTGSHRSHGIALALGVDPRAMALEILGRTGGLSEGLGGTQHLIAPEAGLLGSNGIVGGQVPLAAGAALTAKTRGTGGIAVAFLGDGASNQGGVMETLNLAVALQLPMLFVVENNGFGQSTTAHYAAGGSSLLARARAFGLAAAHVDGGDLIESVQAASRMVSWVRETGTPAFLEASVPRLAGHYHGDKEAYRGDGRRGIDPLDRAVEYLKGKGVNDTLITEMAEGAKAEAEAIVRDAAGAPDGSATAFAAYLDEVRP